MIVRKMFQSETALHDDCLLAYCRGAEHECLYACVQSLFLQKAGLVLITWHVL